MTKASLQQIVKALNDGHIRYLIVGGIAVNAHGYLRLTVDVDLLIQLEKDNILVAMALLEKLGYRPMIPVTAAEFAEASNRERWIAEKQMKVLNLKSDAHRETDIDVFVSDPLGFDEAYKRLEAFNIGAGIDAPICSYQDLVKLKLMAARPKDLLDLNELRLARGEA